MKIDLTGLRDDRLENAGPGISIGTGIGNRNFLKWLQSLVKRGKRVGHNIISRVDDRTQIIFRKDMGKHAHGLPNYPKGKKIDHYNVELQTRSSKKGKWKPRFSLHIVIDKKGRIKNVF